MSKYWPIDVYTDYVTKHASGDQRFNLLHPKSEIWDEDNYPAIIITYHPMPQWMRYSQFISLTNDRDMNFRRLVAMYQMEMRRYISSVEGWLDQMKRWKTGLVLLAEINAASGGGNRRIEIAPFTGTNPNAFEKVRSWIGQINQMEKGAFVSPSLDPFDEDFEALARLRGSGRGSNAIIEFTPDVLKGQMAKPGWAPDEVLFHELVHASRSIRGIMNFRYVSGGYDNQEEFIAIVLTNIYLSEKGQFVLVGDHYDRKTLQGSLADTFLNNSQRLSPSPMQLMQNFRDSQRTLYNQLVSLPRYRPKFNPVREHDERLNDRQRLHGNDRAIF